MIRSSKLKKGFALLTMLFLSWGNFQIKGLYFFVIFQALYCLTALWESRGKLYFVQSTAVNAVMVLLLVTGISALFTDLPVSYKRYSLILIPILVLSYFTFTYVVQDCKRGTLDFTELIKWLKIGFLVQILYLPIQFLLYKVAGIDMNHLLFSDLLHLMEQPTFFRQGAYYPSAFVWHSAVLAPMLVLSMLLFKNTWVRLIIVVDAMICGNNTALVGVLLTVVLLFVLWLGRQRGAVRKRALTVGILLTAMGLLLIFGTGLWQKILDKASYLVYRVTSVGTDSSSTAHASYYTLYPEVLGENSVFANFFGTGYASSGYSITRLNGQYEGLRHWVVESDVMDILISRGIIGFVSYYFFLGIIAIRGRKTDPRYAVAVLVIVLQGIMYNVQFEYLFFIELLMLYSFKGETNFFAETDGVRTFPAVPRIRFVWS